MLEIAGWFVWVVVAVLCFYVAMRALVSLAEPARRPHAVLYFGVSITYAISLVLVWLLDLHSLNVLVGLGISWVVMVLMDFLFGASIGDQTADPLKQEPWRAMLFAIVVSLLMWGTLTATLIILAG